MVHMVVPCTIAKPPCPPLNTQTSPWAAIVASSIPLRAAIIMVTRTLHHQPMLKYCPRPVGADAALPWLPIIKVLHPVIMPMSKRTVMAQYIRTHRIKVPGLVTADASPATPCLEVITLLTSHHMGCIASGQGAGQFDWTPSEEHRSEPWLPREYSDGIVAVQPPAASRGNSM